MGGQGIRKSQLSREQCSSTGKSRSRMHVRVSSAAVGVACCCNGCCWRESECGCCFLSGGKLCGRPADLIVRWCSCNATCTCCEHQLQKPSVLTAGLRGSFLIDNQQTHIASAMCARCYCCYLCCGTIHQIASTRVVYQPAGQRRCCVAKVSK